MRARARVQVQAQEQVRMRTRVQMRMQLRLRLRTPAEDTGEALTQVLVLGPRLRHSVWEGTTRFDSKRCSPTMAPVPPGQQLGPCDLPPSDRGEPHARGNRQATAREPGELPRRGEARQGEVRRW